MTTMAMDLLMIFMAGTSCTTTMRWTTETATERTAPELPQLLIMDLE